MESNKKRAWVYSRSGAYRPKEKGSVWDEVAAESGYVIVGSSCETMRCDDSLSRPGLQQALAAVREKKAELLIVTSPHSISQSRFRRWCFCRKVHRYGAKIVYLWDNRK